MKVLQINQQVKAVAHNCETCGGPHSYNDCPAIVGQTQNVYDAGAYNQGGNYYQPQGNRNLLSYHSDNHLGPPRFNQNQNRSNPNQNYQNRNQGNNHGYVHGNNLGRNKFFQGASHGQNPPPSYQAPAYQAPGYQAPMNTASSLGLGTLPSNTITNPKEDLKVEREPEVTKDTVPPTNNESTKDVQPSVVQIETSIPNPLLLPLLSPLKLPLVLRSLTRNLVDFDADPRVPLILGRSFLKIERALIDVYGGELTLRVGKEAVTFNLDQTLRYPANYNDMTKNRINVIDMACEEYSQEVLGFSDEVHAFLVLEDDPTSPEVDHSYYDTEGDILLLKSFLNDDPSLPPLTQGMYLPQIRKELKICEAKNDKSSINEPPEVELKDLPPYLKYAFLEGDDKLPVIIAKDLSIEEKAALIKVLKSQKQAITWKLSDIKDQKKTTFTSPYGTFTYRHMPFGLCNAPGTFQRCMVAIFLDMIEITMEVFMDDFSVFGNSFRTCLSYLDKMLKRCEDTNLCLNWEKFISWSRRALSSAKRSPRMGS
nr:hypothetical protein [Tanacetum cinerariifolium]